ncbi:MAG: hypothetical protein R8M71_01110 [Alphaproteobacteria bacterium]|nr:hypothetical protein [Alphaproteobacteria bacterium]
MISHAEQFQELNQIRQHETRGQQLDLFQPITPINLTEEYWFFSDLHNLFGEAAFPTNQAMKKTAHEKIIYPYDAKSNIQQRFDFYTSHYECIHHEYRLGYLNFKHATDLKLTRYACWSFLKHIPNAIFGQTYFLAPVIKADMDFNALNKIASEYRRIKLRDDLSRAEKILAGILYSQHANYKDFYNSTSLALFNGKTYNDIKEIHNIPNKQNETLLDYMGRHTLHARIAALYRTFEKYNNSTNKTILHLNEILCNELFDKRVTMINTTGRRPEQDISQQHIDKVKKHLNNTEQAFTKKYSIQKIR